MPRGDTKDHDYGEQDAANQHRHNQEQIQQESFLGTHEKSIA